MRWCSSSHVQLLWASAVCGVRVRDSMSSQTIYEILFSLKLSFCCDVTRTRVRSRALEREIHLSLTDSNRERPCQPKITVFKFWFFLLSLSSSRFLIASHCVCVCLRLSAIWSTTQCTSRVRICDSEKKFVEWLFECCHWHMGKARASERTKLMRTKTVFYPLNFSINHLNSITIHVNDG